MLLLKNHVRDHADEHEDHNELLYFISNNRNMMSSQRETVRGKIDNTEIFATNDLCSHVVICFRTFRFFLHLLLCDFENKL